MNNKVTNLQLPKISTLVADFVYNYFVPDERTTSIQKLSNDVDNIPRYINITFSPSQIISFGTLQANSNIRQKTLIDINDFGENFEFINKENDITNNNYQTFYENDNDSKKRLREKIIAFSELLNLDFSDSMQSQKIADVLKIDRELVQSIMSPYNEKKVIIVNSKTETVDDIIDLSSKLTINSIVNREYFFNIVNSSIDTSPLGVIEQISLSKDVTNECLKTLNKNVINLGDTFPTFNPYEIDDTTQDQQVGIVGIATAGYVITKSRYSNIGFVEEESDIIVLGSDATNYIDTDVLYGYSYRYSVSVLYRVDLIVEDDKSKNKEKKKIKLIIQSKQSEIKTVDCQEYIPPNSPDGVFYKFNYQKGEGLQIVWQIPSGKSRDVKYFQVFKRKTIYEPFSCIAEIDFDDSFIKTDKNEQVRSDFVYKKTHPVTYFEDRLFTRESNGWIYAICAIDAHGFTSGYSAQTLVTFNKVENKISLKNICRPDCPKQYPNLYIDPDLDDNIIVDSFTQDVLIDSNHTVVDLYFTPDAKNSIDNNGKISNILTTNQEQGKYKFHFVNLDLQKSFITDVVIDNLKQN